MHHTLILQEGYPRSPLSQRGVPQLGLPPFATWMLPLKVPGARHVRGAMKTPAKMAEQRSGVNLSPPVPLSRHFDVMAALCFVMRRSCQISGPVTGSVCLSVGLDRACDGAQTKQKGYHLPGARPHCSFIYERKGGEGFHPPCRERRRRRACHPSATIKKDVSGKKNASDYQTYLFIYCINICLNT